MSEIRIVRHYAYPVTKVWRALTDPDLIPLWTVTGAGARPEGFAPVPGTRFRFVAKPKPGWNGIVNCEVVEAREPALLRYTWTDDAGGDTTMVTYRLEPTGDGTRFTYEHTGFTGVGGLFMAQMLGRIRRTMLSEGLPPVLADMGDDGRLRPGSMLRARSLVSLVRSPSVRWPICRWFRGRSADDAFGSRDQQFDPNGGVAGGHLAVEGHQRGLADLGKGCQVVIGPQLVAPVLTRGDRAPDRVQLRWLICP